MDKYSCKILDLSYSDLANVLPFLHWNNWMVNCYKIVLRVKLCSQRFDWSHRWGWSCVIRTAYKGTPLWTVGLSPVVYRALLKLILCVCVCRGEAIRLLHVWHEIFPEIPPGKTQPHSHGYASYLTPLSCITKYPRITKFTLCTRC